MKYYSPNLDGYKPLIYKVGTKNTYWYSHHTKRWVATQNMFPLDERERGMEVTKEQVSAYFCMKELVS